MKIKKYIFKGFGFPVEIHNVPAKEIRGSIEPIINFKELAIKVISEICSDENESPLTGRQVFFLRNHLGMTIREFGKFVEVTHAAVKKWENRGDESIQVRDSSETMLRLKVLDAIGVKPLKFHQIFKRMHIDRSRAPSKSPLQIAL